LDLFVNTLLPRDQKLVLLDNRPLHLSEGTDCTLSLRVLLLWWYEEMIKVWYSLYLSQYLGRVLAREDKPSKRAALSTALSLLVLVPEGKEVLLAMILTKIGDPARKIASAMGHQLRLVLDKHPALVDVVAREVSRGTTVRRFFTIWTGGAPWARCPLANVAHLHCVPPHVTFCGGKYRLSNSRIGCIYLKGRSTTASSSSTNSNSPGTITTMNPMMATGRQQGTARRPGPPQ
jgi:hypothetical protein